MDSPWHFTYGNPMVHVWLSCGYAMVALADPLAMARLSIAAPHGSSSPWPLASQKCRTEASKGKLEALYDFQGATGNSMFGASQKQW